MKKFKRLSIPKRYCEESEQPQQQKQPKTTSISMEYSDEPNKAIVYIYGDIQEDDDIVFEEVLKELQYDEDGNYNEIKEVELNISSNGGSLQAGLQIISIIKEMQSKGVKFTGIVKGKAISMAFLILIVCDVRLARKYSSLMIHPPLISSYQTDNYVSLQDLRDLTRLLTTDWNIMKELLQTHTKFTKNEINKIYSQCLDYYLTVDEAISKHVLDGEL